MKRSLSFVKGKGNINHNNREFTTKNVDAARTEQNITYVREDLKEAYKQEFDQAVQEYNDKQKRKDRKIVDYYEQVRLSKNKEKLYYENVVQVGDMVNMSATGKNAELAKEVLDQYAKEFQQRNPNLHVFNMVLHMDEATPHLHIDYFPVGEGYKNGLNKRASLTKAFENMGFSGNKEGNRFENSTMEWQAREKGRLQEIMQEHGIELDIQGVKRDHLSVDQYKAVVEVTNKRVAKMQDIPVSREIRGKMFSNEITDVAIPIRDYKKANRTIKNLRVQGEALQELTEKVNEKREELQNREVELNIQRSDMARERTKMAQDRTRYETLYKEQQGLNEKYRGLLEQNEGMIRENERLKAHLGKVKEQVKEMVKPYEEQIEDLKDQVKDLNERLDGAYESLANTTKAIGMLKYDQGEYKAELTDQQERLIDGIREYSAYWMEQEGYKELAEDVQHHVGISKGIRSQMLPDYKEIYYRKGEKGYGFYASKAEGGQFLGSKNDLAALKQAFPKATFKDPHEHIPAISGRSH